jgi:hypothetical protein
MEISVFNVPSFLLIPQWKKIPCPGIAAIQNPLSALIDFLIFWLLLQPAA